MTNLVRKAFRLGFQLWWAPVRFLMRTAGGVLAWRRRAEVAEAVAAERYRTIEALTAALQALIGDKPATNGSRPVRDAGLSREAGPRATTRPGR